MDFISSNTGPNGNLTMKGWVWPVVESDDGEVDHHPFNKFIQDQSDPSIRTAVTEAVKEGWDRSTYGVVVGSFEFEKVGSNPYSGYNALSAVRHIVQSLNIPDEDVIVVLSHRSPRLDVWAEVFEKHFDATDYNDFVCSTTDELKRWEWLDTVMNGFKIASMYTAMGYNVAMVDEEGTVNAGLHFGHVVACTLMQGVTCKNGHVIGLETWTFSPPDRHSLSGLEFEKQIDLEELFMSRDCSYKYDLQQKSSSFKILYEHKALATCSHNHKAFYDLFRDTDYLMNAIQSQVSCAETKVDVSSMLSNKIVKKGNKLVVFAGPRETKGIFVNNLFAHHASDSEDSTYFPSFNGWVWPSIPSLAFHYEEKKAHIFDILVTQPDIRPIQNLLIDGLRDSWNSADQGIIIGSQDFGCVGANPFSGHDPVGALKKIMKELEISNNDVTIVLSYRSPLVDHWTDLWRNHFTAGNNYKEFLCSKAESDKRWEYLDTHMDPLKVAHEYRKNGWNVAIIDEEGAMHQWQGCSTCSSM